MEKIFQERIDNFKKLSPIEQYKYVEKIHNILKDVQKLSWRISQFDKKYPLENVASDQYPHLLKSYFDYYVDINSLAVLLMEEEL